jgi:hypothetical protein
MIKQKINRHTWLRGEGPPMSYLIRPEDNKRCCLGQVLGDQGVEDQRLLDQKSPGSVAGEIPGSCQFLLDADGGFGNSALTDKLMCINDASHLSDVTREAELITKFAEGGMEVEFYNPVILLPRDQFGSIIADELRKLDLDVRLV